MAGIMHRFGRFTFDPEQRMLFRDGKPVALMPKTADLLHALLERRGQVVSKEELMKRVWPDTRVEEIGLARNVSLLRKALGEEGMESLHIETVPRRGYRFLADEQPAAPGLVRRSARRLIVTAALLLGLALLVYWQFYRSSGYVPAPPGAARVAVIPFECAGGPLCASAFARSFEDLLAAELARGGGILLVSPSTVHRYRDNGIPAAWMARLLGLDVVLEGSVAVLGHRLRVVARLSDAHSGRLAWSQSFDLAAEDPAQAQREAAWLIASSVRTALTRGSSD